MPKIEMPMPAMDWPKLFQTSSGIVAYRKYVPNRTALGLPMTAKGDGEEISLPFVSILYGVR